MSSNRKRARAIAVARKGEKLGPAHLLADILAVATTDALTGTASQKKMALAWFAGELDGLLSYRSVCEWLGLSPNQLPVGVVLPRKRPIFDDVVPPPTAEKLQWPIRCPACDAPLSGDGGDFCGPMCRWNYQHSRPIPPAPVAAVAMAAD